MIMEKPGSSMVVQTLIIVLICLATCDSKWLAKDNAFIFYFGDVININCTLNDTTKNVTLWKSALNKNEYRQVVPNGHRILQFKQIFQVINLTLSDAGAYQCRAKNMEPFKVLGVHLSNGGIPKPKPDISVVTAIEYGKNVKLKCSAIGHVTLTWYKSIRNGTKNDWKPMDASESDTSTHYTGRQETVRFLVIKNFNVSDNGLYICDLHRYSVDWRARDQKYVGIKDFHKPMFKSFSKSLHTVEQKKDNDYVYFTYSVEGVPTPSINWYRIHGEKEEHLAACGADIDPKTDNCQIILPEPSYITKTVFDKFDLSFPDDNATFKCVASNSLGTATKTFQINILAEPKIAGKEKEFSFVQMYEGIPEIELVCKVEEANPNIINFMWEAQLSGCTNTDCKPNNSNWQTVTGTESGLKILSVDDRSTITLEQSEQHLFYRCTAENTVGEDNRIWKVVPVKGPQPLKAVKRFVDVNEDENVQLSCEVAMFASSQIDWSFNNVVVPQDSRIRIVNASRNGSVYNTLHITKVNVTDAGKYKCFGVFDDILVTDIIQLKVRALKAPSVSLKNLTTKQNSSFIVHCNVSGHPKPEIFWKKDGKIVDVLSPVRGTRACKSRVSGVYMLSKGPKDRANVLVICKADYEKHKGEYSCTARNRLGHDTAKAWINILAPPVIKFSYKTKEVLLGKEFFLKCLASGNPKPRVWWEKRDKNTLEFKRVENIRNGELYFSMLEEIDVGDYRCFAQNEDKPVKRDFKIVLSPVTARVESHTATASNKYPIVVGCVSFFIVAFVIFVAAVLYKRKKAYGGFYILTLPPLPDYIKKLDPHTPLTEQTNKLPYDAEWEFPRNRLKFSRELGSGAFGKVFLADALGIVAFDPRGSTKRKSTRRRFGGSVRRNHYVNNNKMTKVAVKTLKEDSGETEYKDLLSELKILIHVGEHKNIVNLLGACTKGRESELWVIIEYCSNGNLLQFLRNRRDIYETEWKGVSRDPNVQLTMTDLVVVAYQVARGMDFLASRLCIHRDLATRNILVTDNYVIKIADFGLARDVGQDSQYVKTSTGLLPVKWMAIEAIVQRLFTEKSDVWSFGIVLWELFTLGGTPYPNISPNEVAEFLVRGFRMEPPHACPDEISTLMMKCWEEDKDSRPLFKELVQILDKMIELHTSSEGGCGYLEVQGEVMNEYLSPSEVKTPEMDPFQCNSPLPPIPSPGDNENDLLLKRDQNARRGKFHFDKAIPNKGRKDSEIEKMQNDHKPEMIKNPVNCLPGQSLELDGYIDTSLTGKEKERIECEKDRDSSEEPHTLGDYAYWKKSIV